MTTKRKAQGDSTGKAGTSDSARVAAALHALGSVGAFDFINDMLGEAVESVSSRLGIEPPDDWRDPVKHPTVEAFERWLEKVPPTFDLRDRPAPDLAQLISAVLKHPDVPADLYSAMRREIATMTEPDAVNEHPAVLRVALAVHKAEEKGEGE